MRVIHRPNTFSSAETQFLSYGYIIYRHSRTITCDASPASSPRWCTAPAGGRASQRRDRRAHSRRAAGRRRSAHPPDAGRPANRCGRWSGTPRRTRRTRRRRRHRRAANAANGKNWRTKTVRKLERVIVIADYNKTIMAFGFCCSFQSRATFSYRVVTTDRSVVAENVRLSAIGATCRVMHFVTSKVGIVFKIASLYHAVESAIGFNERDFPPVTSQACWPASQWISDDGHIPVRRIKLSKHLRPKAVSIRWVIAFFLMTNFGAPAEKRGPG